MPLEHHYLVGSELHPMHVEQDGVLLPNPYVVSLDQHELRTKTYYRRGSATARSTTGSHAPARGVPARLRATPRGGRRGTGARGHATRDLLRVQPLRVREERAVAARGRVRLTTQDEAAEIRERAESRAAWVDEDDLFSLGFTDFLESLTTGVAAHHAG